MTTAPSPETGGTGTLPSILVLVLSFDREPWRTVERQGQRRTWAAPESVPPGCRVVFYDGRHGLQAQGARVAARLARLEGRDVVSRLVGGAAGRAATALANRSGSAPARLSGDRLQTQVPEIYPFVLPKLLAALRWATSGAAGRFDYVYRANTSAYVALDRLQEIAAGLPRTDCYAGWLGRPPASGPPFVKGAGILLSWDAAERVARHRGPWNWRRVDDAALGDFFSERAVAPIELQRVLLRRPEAVLELPEDELRSSSQFRCKSTSGERIDHLTMVALHTRLRSLEAAADGGR